MTDEVTGARLRIGLAQLQSGSDRDRNLAAAKRAISALAAAGAELVMLPEHVDFIGPEKLKKEMAEPLAESRLLAEIRDMAVTLGLHIHVGSVLERDGERVYNTALVFTPAGGTAAVYRKLHLFDVEIPGGKKYLESAVISKGEETATFAIGPFVFGLATCYDLRFPELFRRLVRQGANVLLLPAAFTMQTGRDHWDILLRARAIENLCWVAAAGQWGTVSGSHICYGRSMVVDPWGLVVARAPDAVTELTADLDLGALQAIRTRFPALDHVRADMFAL